MPSRVLITDQADKVLQGLRAYDRKVILESIDSFLTHEPTKESRSRIKKLAQPAISQFRLRVGDYRVYYDVDEAQSHVLVLHIHKKGSGGTPGDIK